MTYFTPDPKKKPQPFRPGFCLWYYRYHLLVAAPALEFDNAIGRGEQRIILGLSHVEPGDDLRPALADDYRAGADSFAAVGLDSEPLPVRIAAILRGTESFLVCQNKPLSVTEYQMYK